MSALHLIDESRVLPVEAFEADRQQHRREVASLRMQIVARDVLLEEHGIPAPDRSSEEWLAMYRACAQVMRAAHDCVANLGTSAELLKDLP